MKAAPTLRTAKRTEERQKGIDAKTEAQDAAEKGRILLDFYR